jgi:hypothetical protein
MRCQDKNTNIYYHSSARSRPLEGLADSSLRIIESEGATEIAGFVGYPQFLLCLKLSWIKAPRGTPETHPLTIERRFYMVHDHMVHDPMVHSLLIDHSLVCQEHEHLAGSWIAGLRSTTTRFPFGNCIAMVQKKSLVDSTLEDTSMWYDSSGTHHGLGSAQ